MDGYNKYQPYPGAPRRMPPKPGRASAAPRDPLGSSARTPASGRTPPGIQPRGDAPGSTQFFRPPPPIPHTTTHPPASAATTIITPKGGHGHLGHQESAVETSTEPPPMPTALLAAISAPAPAGGPQRRGSTGSTYQLAHAAAGAAKHGRHSSEMPAAGAAQDLTWGSPRVNGPASLHSKKKSSIYARVKNMFKGDCGDDGGGSMEISAPFNFQHTTHVNVDPRSSTGFQGLPAAWRSVLKASGITKEEVAEHPDQVLDVLAFHMEGPPPKVPSRATLQRNMAGAIKITKGDPMAHYVELQKLGQGASGTVYRGRSVKDGRMVALKAAPIAELNDLMNEIGIQSMTEHPNIVNFIEAYCTDKNVWIVMELMEGGCLTDVLGPRVEFPEAAIAYVIKMGLMALAFMHRNHRLHRDIKSDNILVDREGTYLQTLKQ